MLEVNGDKSPLRKSGWYKHRDTGALVELNANAEGTAIIDGFVQVGFVFVGEKPTEVVSELETKTEEPKAADVATKEIKK
jgi:hypothetical protein